MDALVASTHAATLASRPALRAGDRVTDAYCLRETGRVAYVSQALCADGTDRRTAYVRWDGDNPKLYPYAQDTLRLTYRENG